MQGIKLKPCPFCGSEAEINEVDVGKKSSCIVVNFKTCHAAPDGAISISVDLAAAAWNQRAGDTDA